LSADVASDENSHRQKCHKLHKVRRPGDDTLMVNILVKHYNLLHAWLYCFHKIQDKPDETVQQCYVCHVLQ